MKEQPRFKRFDNVIWLSDTDKAPYYVIRFIEMNYELSGECNTFIYQIMHPTKGTFWVLDSALMPYVPEPKFKDIKVGEYIKTTNGEYARIEEVVRNGAHDAFRVKNAWYKRSDGSYVCGSTFVSSNMSELPDKVEKVFSAKDVMVAPAILPDRIVDAEEKYIRMSRCATYWYDEMTEESEKFIKQLIRDIENHGG